MKTWLRKLRGALSLGLMGSLAGAAITGLWGLGSMLFAGVPIIPGVVIFYSVFGGIVGGASGIGFSILVGALASRSTLDQIPLWKAAVWGGAAGIIASFVGIYLATGGLLQFLPTASPFILICTGTGAVLGSGVIRLAQNVGDRELAPGGAPDGLVGDGSSEVAG